MSLNHQISCLFRENFLDEKVIAICGRCMTTRRGKQDKTDIRADSAYNVVSVLSQQCRLIVVSLLSNF